MFILGSGGTATNLLMKLRDKNNSVKHKQDVYAQRRDKLFQMLPPNHVAIVAVGGLQKVLREHFIPNGNFLYLTGLGNPDSIAIFSTINANHEYILFWREPELIDAIWIGPRMDLKKVRKISGADNVYPLGEFARELPEYLRGASHLVCNLGTDPELDQIVLRSRRQLNDRDLSIPTPTTILELNEFLEKMRICKDEEEIAAITRGIAITVRAYEELFRTARPGMYEYELEALLHYIFRKHGAQGTAFSSIVASGPNATILHYSHNNRRIQKNDLLLVDSGAKYDHYATDVSRTWPVNGKFTPAQRLVYEAVLTTQKNIIQEIKPGVSAMELHRKTVRQLTDHLLEMGILRGSPEKLIADEAYQRFYPHKTSHWLGLEVHDIGGYYNCGHERILEPAMVLTIEPGIYIRPAADVPRQFHGIGVRIEDDVLVTTTGCEVLTRAIPKEIEDMEHRKLRLDY